MVLFAESLKQLGDHMRSQLTHAATLFSDQSELGSKVPWGLIMSYHTCLDLITYYISVYCKLSETVLSSISLWQDSSSKTDLPEDLESQQEDSGWLCPATAAVDFAVEVVEAFLATLGKMCHHVLHKQVHVCSLCSLAASLCFGIIGEVRVRSNICWFAQEKISSRSLAAYPYPYNIHILIHIPVEVQLVHKDCRKMFASLLIVGL